MLGHSGSADLMTRDFSDRPNGKEHKTQAVLRQMRDRINELRQSLQNDITELQAILPDLSDFDPMGDMHAYCDDALANQIYFAEQSLDRHFGELVCDGHPNDPSSRVYRVAAE